MIQKSYKTDIKIRQKQIIVTLLILFLVSCKCYDAQFHRQYECLNATATGCHQWNNTINLFLYQKLFGYMCFPEKVHILSDNGPKQISKIEVGDKILSYNFENNKHEYSPVMAWLHRDTLGVFEYNQIKTKGGLIYLSSWGHNIAYVTNEGSVGFKYATDLEEGDQLFSIGGKETVSSSQQLVFEKGMYAPYTKLGNFYIFAENNGTADQSKMILVHCLSQVHNPRSLQSPVYTYLTVGGLIGVNQHKNADNEEYLHPVTSFLSIWASRPLTTKANVNHMNHQYGRSNNQQAQKKRSVILTLGATLMTQSAMYGS